MTAYGHKTINRYHVRRSLQRLSSQMRALGDPGQPSLAGPQGAAVVFSGTTQLQFQLAESFKDLDGDGVWKAVGHVLSLDGSPVQTSQTGASAGTSTPNPPRHVILYDRGGRYQRARTGDYGQAIERLEDGVRTWDVISMRYRKPQYVYLAYDSAGTSFGSTQVLMNLGTVTQDKGGIWELDTNGKEVEILATGPIRIYASVSLELVAIGSSQQASIYLTKDGVEIAGTRRTTDPQVTSYRSVSILWLEDVVAQQKLGVGLIADAGTTTYGVVAGQGSFLLAAPWTEDVTPLGPEDDLGAVFDFNSLTVPYRSDNLGVDPLKGAPDQSAGGPATDYFIEFEKATDSWLVYENREDNNFTIPVTVPSGHTIGVWIRLDEAGDYQLLWKTNTDAIVGVNEWLIEVDSTNIKFTGTLYNATGGIVATASKTHSSVLATATWYFVVCQVDLFTATGSRMRVGVSLDGGAFEWSHAKDATAVAVSGAQVLQDGGYLCMNKYFFAREGVDAGDHAYSVDMLRFWSRLIADSEVDYHYNSGTGRIWPFT